MSISRSFALVWLAFLFPLASSRFRSKQLFCVPIDGSAPPALLHPATIDGSSLQFNPHPSPLASWIRNAAGDSLALFLGDLERVGVVELWACPLGKRGLGRH